MIWFAFAFGVLLGILGGALFFYWLVWGME